MGEFDDAHAFVDGFFAALADRAPQSDSLKSSRDVVDSCLRLGEAIGQEENRNKAASITLASVELVASIINYANVSSKRRGEAFGCIPHARGAFFPLPSSLFPLPSSLFPRIPHGRGAFLQFFEP